MSQVRPREKGWGRSPQGRRATPLRDRKEFHGRRAARKAAGILPAGGSRGTARRAALNNVELITALISCNPQLGLVGLQLRILNGVVSLLTTEVHSKALGAYLSEQGTSSGGLGLTPSALEVLACIAFKQPISQAEIDRLFDADKRGLVVKMRDLKLVEWRNSPVAMAAYALRQPKRSCSALASRVWGN